MRDFETIIIGLLLALVICAVVALFLPISCNRSQGESVEHVLSEGENIRIECIEGHDYIFYNGSREAALVPVFDEEGKPRKCQIKAER